MKQHKQRPSWEHKIETYTGGKPLISDWCVAWVVGFFLLGCIVAGALSAIV